MARPSKPPGSPIAPYVPISEDEWDRIFDRVSRNGSVAAALRATIGERRAPAAYAALRRDLNLKARLASSEQAFRDFLLSELVRRGVHGVDRKLMFKGEVVGYEKEFSDNALLSACRFYIDRWVDKRAVNDVRVEHTVSDAPGALWMVGEDDLGALSAQQKRQLADILKTVDQHRKATAARQQEFAAIEDHSDDVIDADFSEPLSADDERALAEITR